MGASSSTFHINMIIIIVQCAMPPSRRHIQCFSNVRPMFLHHPMEIYMPANDRNLSDTQGRINTNPGPRQTELTGPPPPRYDTCRSRSIDVLKNQSSQNICRLKEIIAKHGAPVLGQQIYS